MATIINFVSTILLTTVLAFGQIGQHEIVDADRIDIKDWSTGSVPAQVVCTREGGDEWSVFLCVTQDLGPNEISVEGNVRNIEMVTTLSFDADDEAIMNMITQARQQGATVEIA